MSLFDEAAELGTPADQVVGKTAQHIHAALAEKSPEGQCSMPAPSFQSSMHSSTTAWRAVEGVELDRAAVEVGQEGEVPPVGPQRRLGTDEPGAAHDEAASLVGALGHHAPRRRRGTRWRPSPTSSISAMALSTAFVPVRTAMVKRDPQARRAP